MNAKKISKLGALLSALPFGRWCVGDTDVLYHLDEELYTYNTIQGSGKHTKAVLAFVHACFDTVPALLDACGRQAIEIEELREMLAQHHTAHGNRDYADSERLLREANDKVREQSAELEQLRGAGL